MPEPGDAFLLVWGDYYESFEPKTFNFKVGPSNDEWKKVLCLENQTLF